MSPYDFTQQVDGFLLSWYEWYLPVVAAAIALVVALAVLLTSDWRTYGTAIKTLAVLAFLGTLPMFLMRIGVDFSGAERTLIMLNIVGGIVSVITGAFHFTTGRRFQRAEAPAAEPVAAGTLADVTPPEAVPAASGSTLDPGPGGDETLLAPEPVAAGAEVGAPPPPAWLVFKSGANAGQTIPVSGAVTSLGRAPENDVVIDDQGASREHAQITFAGGTFQMTDVGSAGGTIVEGSTAAATVPLVSGTEVKIGGTELVFMQGGPMAAGAAAPTAPGPAVGGDAAATMAMHAPKETLMAWLAVTGGPAKGGTCQINVGETTIGRGEGTDLRVNDASVSRNHALIIADEKAMKVLDLGSAGGTKVNGTTIGGRTLSSTSVITVGGTEMMLVGVEQAEGEAPTAAAADATMVAGPGGGQTGVIVVRKGPDAGKTFSLTEGDNVIGRENAAVLLNDPTVSRRHAVLRRTGGDHVIYDFGSSSGTIVDGDRLEGMPLKGGDVINVGRSEIVVMQPSAS